jgi:hypothetical protein
MFDYLGAHPQIHNASRKEPQHFATDLDSGSYMDSLAFVRDRGEYLSLFEGAHPGQLTGEGSTWYLYSRAAASNIRAANPEAKIIAMLRHPVEMLYSLHERRYYAGSEDIRDFGEALAAEEERKQGRRIPSRARNVTALYYRDVGSYADQVERYLDIFGRDAVHIILFDDFIRDPPAAYRGTLEFLGVDPDFLPRLSVVNAAAARRSQRLQQALLRPGVIRAARAVIPAGIRPRVGQAWDRVNSRGKKRAPLDPAVAARLRRELLPDIERTGVLLGRDLAALWT